MPQASAWLASVPFGGYQAPEGWTSPYGYAPGYPDPYGRHRHVGIVPIGVPVTIALTLLGLGLFGGVGAAVGWFGWHTKTAMLYGALAGLATPPLASAVLTGRGEGP